MMRVRSWRQKVEATWSRNLLAMQTQNAKQARLANGVDFDVHEHLLLLSA